MPQSIAKTDDGPQRPTNLHVIPGDVLEDGRHMELVRDPLHPERLKLISWDGTRAAVESKIVVNGRCYVPPEIDPAVLGRLRLPSHAQAYGTTRELFHTIRGLILKYSSLPANHAFLLTCFVLSTHFVDCVDIAPCVLLLGWAPAEALGVLQVLSWVCRHPVRLTDVGLGIPDFLRPTRLICQANSSVQRLIPAWQFPGFGFSRGGSLRELSCATVIFVAGEELKTLFADSCLWISVAPGGRLVSFHDEQRESPQIASLQNQLLSYRLQNYEKVRTSDFDVPEVAGSLRRLGRTLGACIVDAPDLRARLVQELREFDAATNFDQIKQIGAVLIEALLVSCHERRSTVHVGEIAELANTIFLQRGEILQLKPREVGAKLKDLGFCTTKIDSGGRGLYLLGENCKRIHELARSYRVPSPEPGLPGCPHCGNQAPPLQQGL
jgi:hypothetical protein